MSSKNSFKSVDEYIVSQPVYVQPFLQQIRKAIKEVAPQAEEVISYQMPAFKQGEILIWFAAFKKHIGFYPKTSAMTEFKDKIAAYKTSKGTIHFPYDKSLPVDLIKEIVQFRLKEATMQ